MRRAFLAFERRLTAGLHSAAAILLAAAACIGLWQVLARFVLAQPSSWSEVLTRTLLIWMTYLGLAAAFRSGTLATVEIAARLARGRAALALRIVVAAASTTLLGTLAWQGLALAERFSFQTLAGLDVSMAWAYAAVPTGCAFALVAVAAHLLDPDESRGPDL